MTPDRFPDDAYIEDGLLICGDEALTPADVAAALRQRYSPEAAARYMREWRARNPEKVRAMRQRQNERRRALRQAA